MATNFHPVSILNTQYGAVEERGENARLSYFVGAVALCDMIKTTLGPKGMDKILITNSRHHDSPENGLIVTNDGATILRGIVVGNPAAKVLVNISKTQDSEAGDGTTSVCVLAGEMLRAAEKLIDQKLHPQTIIQGYRIATEVARKALLDSSFDNKDNIAKLHTDMRQVARTILSSKIVNVDRELFVDLALKAVLRLNGDTNLDNIQIIKRIGGSISDSYLDTGFILEKQFGIGQPKEINDVKILLANTPLDTDKIKIHGARAITQGSVSNVADIQEAEREKMTEKCAKILAHKPNLFINRNLIYNYPESLLTAGGLNTIEHADFSGVELLALVTGADICSTFDDPSKNKLGFVKKVEEIIIGEDRMLRFSGFNTQKSGALPSSIVIRGPTSNLLDEIERSLHDALCVLSQMVNDSRVVLGGGCSEMLMAQAVDDKANKTEGKKALAVAAFATALRQIPVILADNGGFDSADLLSKLKSAHFKGDNKAGLNMTKGVVGNVLELGIYDSFKVKHQALVSAAEASEMLLRVDNILSSAPRQRR